MNIVLFLPLALAIPAGVALATAGVAAYSGWRNRRSQKKQNEKDRAFQREMYEKQRQDALADAANQNQYNAPVQQMERLRQAGLNPNLIYGNGAESTAAIVRGSQVPTGNQEAPKSDVNPIATAVNTYTGIRSFQTNIEQQQAQTDNLKKNAAVLEQDALLKQAQTAKTLNDSAQTEFQTQQAKALFDSTVMKANLENQQLRANIGISLDQNERAQLILALETKKTNAQIQETFQNIMLKKAEEMQVRARTTMVETERDKLIQESNHLKTMIKTGQLQAEFDTFRNEMMKRGIMPHDAMWERQLQEFAKHIENRLDDAETWINKSPWTR